jgi:hypothetical protein
MRHRLNCWIVAMALWASSHGHQYAWVRRSRTFFQMLPHFGYAERVGLRSFRSIEYHPPRGRLWSADDCGLFFSGHYVVVHHRIVSIRRWATKEQALADHYFGKHHEHIR